MPRHPLSVLFTLATFISSSSRNHDGNVAAMSFVAAADEASSPHNPQSSLSSNNPGLIVNAIIDESVVGSADEHVRARLKHHVEAQVSRLLSELGNAGGGGGGGGATGAWMAGGEGKGTGTMGGGGGLHQRVELKIDLPADLAELVNSGAALKFRHSWTDSVGDGVVAAAAVVGVSSSASASAGGNDVVVVTSSESDGDYASEGGGDVVATTEAILCPLGSYSATGFAADGSECELCPEGQTTLRLGSNSCEVVTEEDILGMLYDVMNGDSWDERRRRGWKSKTLPACEWEGVSCNADGQIIGMAFPATGLTANNDGYAMV